MIYNGGGDLTYQIWDINLPYFDCPNKIWPSRVKIMVCDVYFLFSLGLCAEYVNVRDPGEVLEVPVIYEAIFL